MGHNSDIKKKQSGQPKILPAQSIRRFLVVLSALLFPVTMLYFSPGMVFKGARLGVLSGSYFTFAALFISALAFGRAWCGWLCPVAGFSCMLHTVNGKAYCTPKAKQLKYIIWVLWLIAIAGVAVFIGGGYHAIDLLLGTERGISIHNISLMAVYYIVLGVIVSSSLLLGRRGFCHTLCWMAPFMVFGRKLGNALRLCSLRLVANIGTCSGCGRCEKLCPMGLPLKSMLASGNLEHTDCILCGICSDICPANALNIKFSAPE